MLLTLLLHVIYHHLVGNNMDVNEHKRLSNFTLNTQLKVKEQRLNTVTKFQLQ
jgi:hypothetical protein